MLILVQTVFVLFFILHLCFVKLSVGLPLKDLSLLGLFVLLFLGYPRQLVDALSRLRGLIAIFLALGVLGLCLTFLKGEGIAGSMEAVPRMVVQPFLVVVCTYTLIVLCGVRFVAAVFIGGALITGLFAVVQFADIGAAWQAREFLSKVQNEPHTIASTVRARGRPFGLSLTPIIFSYHLVAAYITANLLNRKKIISDRVYAVMVVAMLVMAAANGTRSLLMGIVLHEVLRRLGGVSVRSLAALAVLAIGAFIGMDYLASVGSRVVTITDASAVGRWTLYEYGLQLVRDNPFGYGWDFNPGDYAWLYWEQLSDMARAEAAFRLDIHNAFLNFVLLYGIYGVLIVAMAALFNPALFIATAYFGIAYFAHSFFHNDGIFLGDDYFWFAFVIFLYMRDQEKVATSRASAYSGRQQPLVLTRPGFTRSH
jgi:hypothetical protein